MALPDVPAFTFSIKTMGCKANIYDSLLIERELRELGGAPARDNPNVFVLNSCTVTAEADRQSLREVASHRKRAPDSCIVLTGCYAQLNSKPDGVDLHVGNSSKGELKRLVAERFGLTVVSGASDPEVYWGQLPVEVGKTRAFLKVQEGCNDRCTYCIIPFARGASRSVALGEVLAETRRLTTLGIHEIVITGTNIADYGKDLALPDGRTASIELLIEELLARTDIARIRLSSLDPTEITDRLLDAITTSGGRVMPHFHVSLQSPVSRVLRAMRRNYRSEEVEHALALINERVPEAFVGMDVIAGFPSETLEEHDEAIRILSRSSWTRLHVFPYSEREGTPATRIAQSVPIAERRRRAAELMLLSQDRLEAYARRFVGRELDGVLFENAHQAEGQWFAVGHAPNYLRVMARVGAGHETEATAMHQRLGRVRVTGLVPKPARDWTLEAELL